MSLKRGVIAALATWLLTGGPGASAWAQTGPADWPTYHHDLQRSGAVADALPSANVSMQWQSPPLDGDVYGEPLYVGGYVFAVTENDTVYALDGQSGQSLWSSHLGEPVPASSLPCGNIDPVGITSTPVIDPQQGLLYTVAFEQPAHNELFALDLASGAVRFHQPIEPPGADPLTHLQRTALTLSQGRVYAGFGGRFGDCGAYHGWVVAASASDGSTVATYQVPTQREGAIWGTGGPSIDDGGNLLVATGNGSSLDAFDFGNAVVKLSPDLNVLDWFAPAEWAAMSKADADLGSTSPVLVGNGMVFEIGKTGIGYLLHEEALGNIGGQAFAGQVCAGAFGSVTYASPNVYVPCRDGLVALQLQDGGASFSVAWQALGTFANPAIVTGGTIWTIGRADGTLYGLSAQDGSTVFQSAPAPAVPPHFVTPGYGGGRILTVWGRSVAAFGS